MYSLQRIFQKIFIQRSIPVAPSFSPTILIENPPVFLYNKSKYRNEKMCAGRFLKAYITGEFDLPNPQNREEVTL